MSSCRMPFLGGCILCLGLLLASCPWPGTSLANSIGEPCLPDGTCDIGTCITLNEPGFNNICTQCGGPGEVACPPGGLYPRCSYANEGYELVNGYCRKVRGYLDRDCGMRGNPPCSNGCYQGTVFSSAAGICVACGDYGQPCCVYTDYPCDYGSCTRPYPYENGICLPNTLSTPGPGPNPNPNPLPSPTPAVTRICMSEDGRHELCRANNCYIPTITEPMCWSNSGRHEQCRNNGCQSPDCYWEDTVVQQGVPCYWQEVQ